MGSCVRRYDPTGALLDPIRVPALNVTACTLGDDDLRTLYITTSQQDLDVRDHPESGWLFSVRVDDAGFVATGFAG